MTNLREWLDSIDLGQYADEFETNAIDWDLLPDLEDEDLEKIGVRALGHRKRLLKAISSLDAGSVGEQMAVRPVRPVRPAEAEPAAVRRHGEAERRQLTVMFCDLVGSTSLAEAMDPEEYRDLLSAYQSAAGGVVEQFNGYIARYMGDGLLVYFGYPAAKENDPERAVRAGLAIVEAVGTLEGDREVRIGVATGPVVVGDIIGEGASEEAAVLGETPNLAARLQGTAAPNTVLISATTHELVAGQIESEVRTPVELKGFSRPIAFYQAIRPRSPWEVSEARRDIAPLVGRDVEIALLERAWQTAQSSEGQALLLVADPGVGKSRLLRAFQDTLVEESRTRVAWYCSPYHQTTANYPGIEQLKRALGVDEQEPDRSINLLEDIFKRVSLDVEVNASLIARLLSLPVGSRYEPPDLAPAELKRRTISAQVELLLAAAKQRPVLFIVEDLHWADPTTLEVLEAMIEAIRDERVLLLMTARPEFTAPWANTSHALSHRLGHLSRRDTLVLVQGVVENQRLSPELLEQIAERTDGVPLFIEELTKSLLESAGELGVPASLQDSLMARLDRLGSSKELAQTASVIGRNFSLDDLCALSEQSPKEVATGLESVVTSGLVHRRRGTGVEYEFKHALVRDAAYASLLKRKRRSLHKRYAHILEQDLPGRATAEPAVLAHHYTEAGLVDPALACWLVAGQRSVQRCAHAEAIADLLRGLALIEVFPEGEAQLHHEIAFRLALGVALLGKEGAASQAVADNYLRAQALCERAGEREQLYPIIWGLWFHHFLGSELREAGLLADRLLELGQNLDDVAFSLEGHHCQWATRFVVGNLSAAMEHCEKGIDLYRREEHHALTFVYGGHDPGVCARNVSAIGLWLQGYPERSEARSDSAFSLAKTLNHSATMADALQMVVELSVLQRDVDAVERQAAELLELAIAERAFPNQSLANGLLGWVLFQRGAPQKGLSLMREAAGQWLRQGTAWTGVPISLVAESLGQIEEVEEALKLVNETLVLGHRDDVHWWEAELYRVKGELLIKRARGLPEAEETFVKALEIARRQDAKSLELRVAVSLARLLQRKGKRDESLELLTPVYDWFTEGFDSPDLKEARALLDELS